MRSALTLDVIASGVCPQSLFTASSIDVECQLEQHTQRRQCCRAPVHALIQSCVHEALDRFHRREQQQWFVLYESTLLT